MVRRVLSMHNQFEPKELRNEITNLFNGSFLIRYMSSDFGVASTLPIHENTVEVLAQTGANSFYLEEVEWLY